MGGAGKLFQGRRHERRAVATRRQLGVRRNHNHRRQKKITDKKNWGQEECQENEGHQQSW